MGAGFQLGGAVVFVSNLDRSVLRKRSAYRDTHASGEGVTVEARDPDDLVLMLVYRPPGQPGLRALPARVYAW
jgi:hypothetical protein